MVSSVASKLLKMKRLPIYFTCKKLGAFIVYSWSFNLADLNRPKEQSTSIRDLWSEVVYARDCCEICQQKKVINDLASCQSNPIMIHYNYNYQLQFIKRQLDNIKNQQYLLISLILFINRWVKGVPLSGICCSLNSPSESKYCL